MVRSCRKWHRTPASLLTTRGVELELAEQSSAMGYNYATHGSLDMARVAVYDIRSSTSHTPRKTKESCSLAASCRLGANRRLEAPPLQLPPTETSSREERGRSIRAYHRRTVRHRRGGGGGRVKIYRPRYHSAGMPRRLTACGRC